MTGDPQPRADDFPTIEAYHEAWHLWRALRRDAELTPDERAAKWQVIDQALAERHQPGNNH